MVDAAPEASAFTILTVCSGNICRSPIAQQLLRARLADAPTPFQVLSAGTIAASGQHMTDEAVAQSRRFGGRPDGHLSTPLSERLIARSQLVLTATRDHRAAVASLLPRASRVAFTLNQFARLAASIDLAELASLASPIDRVAAVAAQRGYAQPETPEDDDIEDPYLESIEVYERVAVQIDRDIAVIAAALTGGRVAGDERPRVSRPDDDDPVARLAW
jgi:protein-tyrosine phosphatase